MLRTGTTGRLNGMTRRPVNHEAGPMNLKEQTAFKSRREEIDL